MKNCRCAFFVLFALIVCSFGVSTPISTADEWKEITGTGSEQTIQLLYKWGGPSPEGGGVTLRLNSTDYYGGTWVFEHCITHDMKTCYSQPGTDSVDFGMSRDNPIVVDRTYTEAGWAGRKGYCVKLLKFRSAKDYRFYDCADCRLSCS